MSSEDREQLFESVGKRLAVGPVGEAHGSGLLARSELRSARHPGENQKVLCRQGVISTNSRQFVPLPANNSFRVTDSPLTGSRVRYRGTNPRFGSCTGTCGLGLESTLRAIPSFFIRRYKVERFNPKRAAAPLGPARTHRVSFRVARM